MRKILTILAISTLAFTACGKKNEVKNSDAAKTDSEKLVLKIGDKAPLFSTFGALAGEKYDLDLAKQLEKGPVVLYFFPKVFTPGCTAEAHEFAEKTADFEKLGASIIGMSGDDIEGLKKFSKEACRDKFSVAMATPDIIKSYNVSLGPMNNMTSRTSYVIGKDGLIKFIHSEMDYKDHVKLTYEAVKALKDGK